MRGTTFGRTFVATAVLAVSALLVDLPAAIADTGALEELTVTDVGRDSAVVTVTCNHDQNVLVEATLSQKATGAEASAVKVIECSSEAATVELPLSGVSPPRFKRGVARYVVTATVWDGERFVAIEAKGRTKVTKGKALPLVPEFNGTERIEILSFATGDGTNPRTVVVQLRCNDADEIYVAGDLTQHKKKATYTGEFHSGMEPLPCDGLSTHEFAIEPDGKNLRRGWADFRVYAYLGIGAVEHASGTGRVKFGAPTN